MFRADEFCGFARDNLAAARRAGFEPSARAMICICSNGPLCINTEEGCGGTQKMEMVGYSV